MKELRTLDEINMEIIAQRIVDLGGSRAKAAISLGISVRTISNVLNRMKYLKPDLYSKVPRTYKTKPKDTLRA